MGQGQVRAEVNHHDDLPVWVSKYRPIDKHFLQQRNINVLRSDHNDEVVMKILIGEEFQTYIKIKQIFDENKEKTKYLVPILDAGRFDFLKEYAIVPKATCTLTKYLAEKQENSLDDLTICLQITESLQQLHDLNVIHCNLCPDNIFYFEEEARFKIGNFNSARICPFNKDAIEKFEYLYQAPEVLQSLDFSTMSDVFSLGVVIFQILSKSPFIDSLFRKSLTQLVLGESKELVKIIEDSKVTKKLQEILQPLLNIDPETRSTTLSIIQKLSMFKSVSQYECDSITSNYDPSVKEEIKKLCAIDFGTTHLSIQYCDYVTDINLDIFQIVSNIFSKDRVSAYFLLQPDMNEEWKCTHVGSEAIDEYKRIQNQNKYNQQAKKRRFCLFSNFKMEIYKIVTGEIDESSCEVAPIVGEAIKFKIMDLLAKTMRYLTELSLSKMRENDPTLNINNIIWILTIPTIWRKRGARIMINSLKKGWPEVRDLEERVECVLEPEMGTIQAILENDLIIPSNKNIAILDIGGTSDLNIFKYENEQITELDSSYGPFGGESIDRDMLEVFSEILSEKEITDNLMSLRTKWEEAKQSIRDDSTNQDTETLYFDSFFEFSPSPNKTSTKITILERDLIVKKKCILDIYHEWATKNAQLVLYKMKDIDIEMIILVGGMVESKVFQAMIKKELINSGKFNKDKIIITKNPKLSIIRGAILHGLKRKPVIVSRISSHTYGFACKMRISTLEAERKEKLKLDQYKNKIVRKLSNKGEDDFLFDSISIFMKKGESIPLNWEKVEGFIPSTPNSTTAYWRILESDEEYPMLESECRVIATFIQPHPEEFTKLEWKNQNYDIKFNFTNTVNVSIKYNFETKFKSIPQLDFDIE